MMRVLMTGIYRLLVVFGVVGVLFMSGRAIVSAHAMSAEDIEKFISAHPNAPAEEIAWLRGQHQEAVAAEAVGELERAPSFWANGLRFIELGIEHIFTGIDHVLFLVAMMLTFVSVRDVFKRTGTFTLAHTGTLFLAGTLLLEVSSSIVEPLIAFSIAYVAITSVFLKHPDSTRGSIALLPVFFFGLIHGLGFAGVLREVDIPGEFFFSSLVFFNVGVEIGQLLIVGCIIAPLVYWTRTYSWHTLTIKVTAGVLAVVGIVWGVVRLLG